MPAATPTEAAAAPPPSPVAATSPVVAARKSITGGIKTNGSGSNPTTTTIAAQMHTDALKMQQIAKLKILYDQKFSSHCALGRDLKEKQAVSAPLFFLSLSMDIYCTLGPFTPLLTRLFISCGPLSRRTTTTAPNVT